jgi:hypothetical protein
MPATAREPSGTRVLVLCGQPLQNQGVRSPVSVLSSSMARSRASMVAMRASMRAMMSCETPSFFRRLAMALAMMAGVRSALARSSQFWLGLGMLHSPPEASPPGSSNLPSTLGRTSARQLYSSSLSWYSMTWRFSSTTRISCSPSAKLRVMVASSGHTTLTLCTRMPSWRQVSSSRPRSISAWRVSL